MSVRFSQKNELTPIIARCLPLAPTLIFVLVLAVLPRLIAWHASFGHSRSGPR